MLGIFYDKIFLEHDTGSHPENPTRLTNTIDYFKKKNKWDNFQKFQPRECTVQEIALNHKIEYIKYVENLCTQGGGFLDGDTIASSNSYKAALKAAGAVVESVDKIMNNEIKRAFCIVRPPGHHALYSNAMGFCLFNNVAIGAKYLLKNCNEIKRILIVDFDVHHGNGTQDSFYNSNEVMYFSMHRSPFYPGTGQEKETGNDKGKGFTINKPLSMTTTKETYISIFQDVFDTQIKDFKPQFIFISAGFDAYTNDPIGSFCLEPEDYYTITDIIVKSANKYCDAKIISTLEGGYNLHYLPVLIEQHLNALKSG